MIVDHPDAFQHAPRRRIRVSGPYHAPHLHANCNVEEILQSDKAENAEILSCRPSLPICSQSSGADYVAPSLGELLQQIIDDILLNRQNLTTVFEKCTSVVTPGTECEIISATPDNIASDLASALERSIPDSGFVLCDLQQRSSAALAPKVPAMDKIAIVGMSGRFPGGQNWEEFWEVLEKGLDMHREVSWPPLFRNLFCWFPFSHLLQVPPDRFDATAHTDPSGRGRNKSHTPFGCFIENSGLFDPRFFNMSPREAAQTDPMQRLALVTAFEALEMAGYSPNRTPSSRLDRIGTFYGQTSDDWREVNEAQDIDTYFITGGVRAFGPVCRFPLACVIFENRA